MKHLLGSVTVIDARDTVQTNIDLPSTSLSGSWSRTGPLPPSHAPFPLLDRLHGEKMEEVTELSPPFPVPSPRTP